MSDISENNNEISEVESFKIITIICPKCKIKKKLNVPEKIINQSKQLTTISVPAELCCEHSFQAFVDKNFKVRGYQQVDFAFSSIEYLDKDEEGIAEIPEFEQICNLIRHSVDDSDILGGAILTIDGKVLYSSLPAKTFSSTIREFEVRAKKNLIPVQKMFLELSNNQKICSQYMKINQVKFILILIFSDLIKLGMGNLLLKELTKKVTDLY